MDGGSVGLVRPSNTPFKKPPPARKNEFRRCAISDLASNSRALAAASFLAWAFSLLNRWFSSYKPPKSGLPAVSPGLTCVGDGGHFVFATRLAAIGAAPL